MDFQISEKEWAQRWYGGWVDLLGDSSEETLQQAKDVLRYHFDITHKALLEQQIHLSETDMQFIHHPGESIGWKAPASLWEVLPCPRE